MNNYKVYLNGEEIVLNYSNIYEPPYHRMKKMPYANFSSPDNSEIVIHSETKLDSVMIRPLSYNIDYTYSEHEIRINLPEPKKFSVEINGSHKDNILIFANRKREYEMYENVIRFEKGVHEVGVINIEKDNTTVYLEEGAFVIGKINCSNRKNVTVCGLGIFDMEKYPRYGEREFHNAMRFFNNENLKFYDVTVTDSVGWTFNIRGCDNVHFDNVKIIGSRGNSDGIDICGSRNVLVENIFTRTWDDSFVVKAFDSGDLENVTFKDSVLWNDFARPIEIGVEIRADRAHNVVFDNIDIIHSLPGYPVMGIHHGDRAIVSDIVFNNIRIEDAPGAQLFDIRITKAVWNKDETMGRIENIKLSNIYLIEEQDILPSKSRLEGYSPENNIKNVTLENINLHGKFATTPEECNLNIMDYVDNVKFIKPEEGEKINLLASAVEIAKPFELCRECGKYKGTVRLSLTNNNEYPVDADAYLLVSPKNRAVYEEKPLKATVKPGETVSMDYDVIVPAGKFMFEAQSTDVNIELSWMLHELDLSLEEGIKNQLAFSDCFGNKKDVVVYLENGELVLESELDKITVFSANPVPMAPNQVLFSIEETDWGAAQAVINGPHGPELAPQLRCPAEITYVFKNEPKVSEIRETVVKGNSRTPLSELGVTEGADSFWLELTAETPETEGHRYPFSVFASVVPEEIVHMFANAKIR